MDRKVLQNISLVCCLALLLCSCKKDKPEPGSSLLPKAQTGRVLVVCEGSLGNGNAELSVYYPTSDSVFNDVFKTANSAALGDVFQSILRRNDQYFLCINNSDQIIVINRNSWRQEQTINVPKPRYLTRISDNKAYVGSLFSNKLYVINTASATIEKTIDMPYANVEGILVQDNAAYVCCWDTACNKVYSIDTRSDKLTDSISVAGYAPQSILKDKDNAIWVMGGNAYKKKSTSLSRIDMTSKKLLHSFIFPAGVEAIKPCINPTADSLYFLEINYSGGSINNGVYRMHIDNKDLPGTAFISCKANQYYWGLGIDPRTGAIFVGDPKGFVQKGTVSVYTPKGDMTKEFNTGLGVSAFYFD
jgi:DNA-binding beta-propeller fold protein YncE